MQGTVQELLASATASMRDRRTDEALPVLDEAERRLADTRPDDTLHGEVRALRAHVLRVLGDAEGSARAAHAVVERAGTPGWDAWVARAATELGWLARAGGDAAAAERWMRVAVEHADRSGRGDTRVQARCALADVLSMHGDGTGAERLLAEAGDIAGEPSCAAEARLRVHLSRGLVAQRLGRTAEAEQALLAASRLAREVPVAQHEIAVALAKLALARGDPVALVYARRAVRLADGWKAKRIVAATRTLLGEVARSLGRHEEAERAYRGAEALYAPDELFGLLTRLNRAQVAIARGRVAQAAALAGPLRAAIASHPVGAAVAALCLVPHAAAQGERARVDELVAEAIGRVAGAGATHADLATLAEVGAFAAREAHLEDAAVRLAALALEQWRRIGHATAPHRVGAFLHGLRRPVPLGPFLLDGELVAGASGQVWRARHAASGHPAAVKVLRVGQRGVSARASFVRELRAVAALDHPNVVALLDHGHVDDAAALAEPSLEADAPWLAFELAPHGTLEDLRGRLPWTEVRRLVGEVLDGLGHAHVRGLLHLDLKPSNVLLAGDAARPTAKLADFGMSRAPTPGAKHRPAGTPAYMAPEQYGDDGSRIGTWTDLYALAGLVYALLGGEPVFGRDSPHRVREAHLHRPPPPLRPLVPVPTGLQDWLDRLLVKDPARRLRRVPDAIRALEALTAAAVPRRLDPEAVPSRPAGLAAAGIGLVSLRRPATVGRARERELLWGMVRQVEESGTGAIVTLAGPPGAGARHLARWLAERVEETGVGRAWVVTPESGPPPSFAEIERHLPRTGVAVVGVHHADRLEGGRALLEGLAGLRRPVLVVATVDPSCPWLDTGQRVVLAPLEDDAVRALIASYLPVHPELARAIALRAGGNPAEVVRLVRRLAEDRQLVARPDGWTLRPGADLDAVAAGAEARARTRVAALRASDRRALDVLVGLGGCAVAAWEATCLAAGVADPAGALERLAREGLIVVGDAAVRPDPVVGRILPARG